MISFLWRASLAIVGFALSGCAVPVIAGFTLNEMSSATSVVSTLATGKGTGEHALDLVTGKDCRFLEGLVREDRKICESPGSPATAEDFKGVFALASKQPDTHDSARNRSVGPIASALADRNKDQQAAKTPARDVLVAHRGSAATPKLIASRVEQPLPAGDPGYQTAPQNFPPEKMRAEARIR